MSEHIHYGPFYEAISKLFDTAKYLDPLLPLLAIGLLFILVRWTWCADKGNKKVGEVIFIGVGILIIFLYRGLSFYRDQLNPDEGQLLTAALGIISDGKLWVSADTTTLGPVCYLLIVLVSGVARLFGLSGDITYFLSRFICTMLVAGTFFFLYKTSVKKISLRLSRGVLLFFVFFFSFCNSVSYSHDLHAYNTEFVFCFVFSVCLFLLYKIKEAAKYVYLISAGVLCGLLPYVKLQTVPMMAAYIVWVLYEIWRASKTSDNSRTIMLTVKKCAVFLLGVFIPTIILVIYCSTYESGLSNAWFFYIENASAHVDSMFTLSFLERMYQTLIRFIGLSWYNSVIVLTLLSVVLLLLARPRLTADLLFSGLILLSAFFALLRTGSFFLHYMVFLVVPSLLFLITTLQLVGRGVSPKQAKQPKHGRFKRENILVITMLVLWIFLFHGFFSNIKDQIKSNKIELVGKNQHLSNISQFIMQQTNHDDYIVIWGWDFRLYVYTSRRSATAQGNIERIWTTESDPDGIWGDKYPRKNIDIYIHGLKANKPKLIIDIVAPGSFGFYEEKYSIQNNKEVWAVIKDDYELTHRYGPYEFYSRKNVGSKVISE
jgi:hypothetical protein